MKKYELIIRVLLAETTDDPTDAQAWSTEQVHVIGTLGDLSVMLNNNGAAQTTRQMATRLIQQNQKDTWTD